MSTRDEDVASLIDDPWKRFACAPDPAGCAVEFEDPEYPASGRDALYYVRVHESESMALNGAPLSTEFDAEGNPVSVRICRGEYGVDGCPAPVREQAWSSPIFVDRATR